MAGRVTGTTGDVALDREIDALYALINSLSAKVSALSGQTSAATSSASSVTASQTLTVITSTGTGQATSDTLEMDDAAGFAVSQNGSNAKVSRTAGVTAGAAVAAAGAAGTSIKSANEDHVHAGVATMNGLTGAVSVAANGGCTVTVVGQTIKISVP